ncbi:MAG: LptF/LptG family permease [Campylobacterota bacterium]|nr:LptF/LptG family permease [Campylobacterota bacterium]
MLSYRYIAFHYLKFFIVIMSALILFVVGIDYMENSDSLPDSANLKILYMIYVGFMASDMLLPLSLVFAMISTKIFLIRSNALVAFYSLGYSKTDILKPFVLVSSVIILLFIMLHGTDKYAKAREYSKNIRDKAQYMRPSSDLFFTFSDQYVYFGRLFPLQKRAQDVRIFKVKDNALQEVIVAESATYRDGYWHIDKARSIKKPERLGFNGEGITIMEHNDLKMLKDFKPKILDQVYEGKVNFTIGDAFDAIDLLSEQKVNIDNIKSALYKIFIYPLFVPFLVVIIFFFVPISPRFLNLSLFSFGAILSTLLVWGVMFMLIKLANNRTIPSEVGIILPVFILFLGALYQWRHYRVKA